MALPLNRRFTTEFLEHRNGAHLGLGTPPRLLEREDQMGRHAATLARGHVTGKDRGGRVSAHSTGRGGRTARRRERRSEIHLLEPRRRPARNGREEVEQRAEAGVLEAGLPNGHSHQLRDTAAVEWLKVGIPLEEVSKLLGHASIRTTEKHYAPWVKSRQDRLDDLVIATWKNPKALERGEFPSSP